jgi:hypothetical protein
MHGSRDHRHVLGRAIPEGTNVLIAHGPPYGVLDQVLPAHGEQVGCPGCVTRWRPATIPSCTSSGTSTRGYGQSGERQADLEPERLVSRPPIFTAKRP